MIVLAIGAGALSGSYAKSSLVRRRVAGVEPRSVAHERAPAARAPLAAAPPLRPAAEPAPHDEPWDACRIRVRSERGGTRFYAEPLEDGPVLAESPQFWADRDAAGEDPVAARAALAALVESLTAAGWVVGSRGRAPWDLELRRASERKRRRRAE